MGLRVALKMGYNLMYLKILLVLGRGGTRKLSTGKPYAGEPHVRFGERGGLPLYPYREKIKFLT